MNRLIFALFLFVIFMPNIQAQDIIIGDFEGSEVANWNIAGKAFGEGPSSGLDNKSGITGSKGKLFVNSGKGGDSLTGMLVSPPFIIERGYINFLIAGGNWPDEIKVELIADKKVVRTTSGTHQKKMIWQTWDVEEFKGSTAIITIKDESKREWGFVSVDHFVQSDKRMYRDELYRPQFHFTPWVNWMNDPHGLVYYKGEYHLFFQHNPHARKEREATHNNTHWGHAVSKDLIHWKQLPNVLAPDELGLMFSGSAAVDFDNTAGFKTGNEDVILAFYTANKEGQSQCMA
ncbi:MAG: hypothetical protein ACYTE8_10060, partial [Planctomycetota bacterium]